MANKNQEPLSKWGCAKTIFIIGIIVMVLASTIDRLDDPTKHGSVYARVAVWLFLIVVVYGLANAKFKKGWFD